MTDRHDLAPRRADRKQLIAGFGGPFPSYDLSLADRVATLEVEVAELHRTKQRRRLAARRRPKLISIH